MRVETQDGWSTQIQLTASSTAGEFTFASTLAEENFLGSGNFVSVGYRDEPDRTAVTLSGTANRVNGTKLTIGGIYDNLSDGNIGIVAIAWPFRSLSDRNAFVMTGESTNRKLLQFRDGFFADSFKQRVVRLNTSVAHAIRAGAGGYTRVGFVGQVKREEIVLAENASPAVPDTVTAAVGGFVEWLQPNFLVLTHYNAFGREEDIDLSTRVRFTTWVAPESFGYERNGIGPGIDVRTGLSFGKNFLRIGVSVRGLFNSSSLDSGTVSASMTMASYTLEKNVTVLHARVGLRKNQPPGFEFDLGSGFGPRAFASHAFTGNRTAWGILEHRFFVFDQILGLFGIGLAGFVDYGGAWFSDQPARFGGDVGGGLRFGTTRSNGENVGRFDFAYQFGDGVNPNKWVVSIGRAFIF